MKIEVKCDNCGGEIIKRRPSEIKNHKHHFCNHKCTGEWKSKNCVGKNGSNWQGGNIEVECNYCGKKIKKHPCWIKKNKYHFCSHKCQGKWQYKKTEIKCDFCGETIKKNPSQIKKGKYHFCNRKCKDKWSSKYCTGENSPTWKGGEIEVDCDFCGKKIKRIPYHIKYHKHHFCNKDCQNKWVSKFRIGENSFNWRDGRSNEPYPPDFNDDLREQIRKRDHYQCQECGVLQKDLNGHHKKLTTHHIDYDKKNSIPTNLIALCSPCNLKANYNRDNWTKYYQDKMKVILEK